VARIPQQLAAVFERILGKCKNGDVFLMYDDYRVELRALAEEPRCLAMRAMVIYHKSRDAVIVEEETVAEPFSSIFQGEMEILKSFDGGAQSAFYIPSDVAVLLLTVMPDEDKHSATLVAFETYALLCSSVALGHAIRPESRKSLIQGLGQEESP
jgi:hypothetical protein